MRKILLTLLLFSVPVTFNVIQAQGAIPADLRNGTILIMKAEKGIMQKSFNKKLQKAFGDYYDGPFELVGKKDLEDPKYADSSIYRYVLDAVMVDKTEHITRTATGQSTRTTYIMDVFFYDRLEKKKLPRTGYIASTYITSVRQLAKHLKKIKE